MTLDGLVLRPATPDDLPACETIWRAGLDGYLRPLGLPDIPGENPGLRRLHAHTLATDPDRFWVAVRNADGGDGPAGRVVGFGSAVQRGSVAFLSMLFVVPSEQARGIGRTLLERVLPRPLDGHVLATATDSAQPISNALYASLGIVPRVPLFNLIGRPSTSEKLAQLPPDVRAERLSSDSAADVDRLDDEVLGFRHPQDHAFVRADQRIGFGYRDGGGQLVGYGYASESGRVGPLAVRDPGLLAPVLAHVLGAVEPRGASSVWLSGSADRALVLALRSGLRIEGFPVLLCWSRPFADLARYVPTSPGLL